MSAQTNALAAGGGSGHRKTLHSNSSAAQRQRLLARLESGPVTTLEARSELDVMHPGGRVMELRRDGHRIETHRTTEPTPCGKLHSVARYVLQPPEGIAQSSEAANVRSDDEGAR